MSKEKEYIIMIPEAMAAPWFLEGLHELLLEYPGKTAAYGIVGGISDDGELVPRSDTFDLDVKIKVDGELEEDLYGLMDEMLIAEVDDELERLNATVRWTVSKDEQDGIQWWLAVTRRGKVLAEIPASLENNPLIHMRLLAKTNELEYPGFFKPFDEDIMFCSEINPEVRISEEEFDRVFDSGDKKRFDDMLIRLGIPTGQNDPCWCGSGDKRKRCHG